MRIKAIWMFFLLIITCSITAQDVDIQTAETVAKNYYFQQVNTFEKGISFDNIAISNTINDNNLVYIFEMNEGGYVAISASKAMYPVICFTSDKKASWENSMRSPEFRYYYGCFANAIKNIVDTKYAQEKAIADAWKTYSTTDVESLLASKDNVEVGPLLNTAWNQDYPYNYYAPLASGGPGGRCYAGCVATAMSVVMEYWRWPLQGQGNTAYYCAPYGVLQVNYAEAEYNWDAMTYDLNNTSSEESVKAIAELQYHAGVSVQMQYNPSGSGAQSANAVTAAQNFFKYPYTQYFSRDDHNNEWTLTLIDQLDNKYVLYHSGYELGADAGHAWNCDGYRIVGNDTTFHHNFNWGGSGNGWFTSANPGGFNSGHMIIKDFYPDEAAYPYTLPEYNVLTAKTGRVYDGSGPKANYPAGSHIEWLIQPQQEYDSVINITLTWELFALGEGDFIRVYDGNSTGATLIGEYTCTSLHSSVTSTGNEMYISFNAVNSGEGFAFAYSSTLPVYCSGTQNINEPVTLSPCPEGKYYKANSLCIWKVVFNDGTPVQLKFNMLDTYDANDYIQIYDMGTGGNIGRFYGNELPETIVTSSGGAYLNFVSDRMNTIGFGFEIDCSRYEVGIEDEDNETLSVYPNPNNGSFNVVVPEQWQTGEVTISVYSINGQTVYKNILHAGNEKQIITINLDVMPNVYFVVVNTGKSTISEKLIIQ